MPDAVLIGCTALWGLAFLVAHTAVSIMPPLPFVALRFGIAALGVAAITGARPSHIGRLALRGGLAIAAAMLCGYALQAAALGSIGAGRTAFVCALYVPLVPLIQAVARRASPPPAVWLSTGLACAGMMLLAGGAGGGFGPGEGFALAAAFAIAAEILLVGLFAPGVDPRHLALVECMAVCLAATLLSGATGEALPPFNWLWVGCTVFLGVASTFLQLGVNWAMRRVPATRATVIFATEPVWAALFGALAGERLGAAGVAGAALILGGLLISPKPGAVGQTGG